jgi:hypothetical protein
MYSHKLTLDQHEAEAPVNPVFIVPVKKLTPVEMHLEESS